MTHPRHHLPTLLAALFLASVLGTPAVAYAWKPDAARFQSSDRADNLQRVPPTAQQSIPALLNPLKLDDQVIPGVVLSGISLQPFWVELQLTCQAGPGSVFLLPKSGVEGDFRAETPSFQLAVDGSVPDEAFFRIAHALGQNDKGDFWPINADQFVREKSGRADAEVPTQASGLAADAMLQADASHLWGDLFLSLWLLLFVLATPALVRVWREYSRWDWAAATLVLLVAAAWRYVYYGWAPEQATLVWEPTAVLPDNLRAWLWHSLSRFTQVTPQFAQQTNLVLGALTAPITWLAVRQVLGQGGWAPLAAGLFVACWPLHVRLSGTPTAFVGFALLMATWVYLAAAFARIRSVWLHLLAVSLAWAALFARAEAVIVMLPLLAVPWLMTPKQEWKHLAFWLPQALVVVGLALATVLATQANLRADPYLPVSVTPGSWLGQMGRWVFSYVMTPFPALVFWAAAIAGKPWKGPLRGYYWVVAASLMVVWAVYFHGDAMDPAGSSRAALAFLVPLTGLAALGAEFLRHMLQGRANLVFCLGTAVLLLAPMWHWPSMEKYVPFHMLMDFLL